jgi:hypothetical protein
MRLQDDFRQRQAQVFALFMAQVDQRLAETAATRKVRMHAQ